MERNNENFRKRTWICGINICIHHPRTAVSNVRGFNLSQIKRSNLLFIWKMFGSLTITGKIMCWIDRNLNFLSIWKPSKYNLSQINSVIWENKFFCLFNRKLKIDLKLDKWNNIALESVQQTIQFDWLKHPSLLVIFL